MSVPRFEHRQTLVRSLVRINIARAVQGPGNTSAGRMARLKYSDHHICPLRPSAAPPAKAATRQPQRHNAWFRDLQALEGSWHHRAVPPVGPSGFWLPERLPRYCVRIALPERCRCFHGVAPRSKGDDIHLSYFHQPGVPIQGTGGHSTTSGVLLWLSLLLLGVVLAFVLALLVPCSATATPVFSRGGASQQRR
jgi:hypothetical protein